MPIENLLTPESFATYATFLAGGIFTIFGWAVLRYLNRKKPRIVKVNKVDEKSLLEISSEFADEVRVYFADNQIYSFYQTQIQIYNSSDDRIDNVKLEILFDEFDYLDIAVEDTVLDRDTPKEGHITDNKLLLSLPYLNSRQYKDKITVNILSQKPVTVNTVHGGGPDWDIKYSDIVALQNSLEESLVTVELGGVIGLVERVLVSTLLSAIKILRSRK